MQTEIIVTAGKFEITSNFAQVKAEMAESLKAYEIEVTEENLSEAKKMAADLNKLSTSFKRVRIDKSKEFSIPIDEFRKQAEELEVLALASREKILAQVKKFEDRTRALCLELMQKALETQYAEQGIREEFQGPGYEKVGSLVGISHVTASGSLKKAAAELITAIATSARAIQDRTDGRLSRLEAESLKAGLRSPLDRSSVDSVLVVADDATYAAHLQKIIGIELKRQEAAEAKIRAEEEAKARRKIEEENRIANEKAEKEAREAKEKADREAQEKARIEAEAKKEELRKLSAKFAEEKKAEIPPVENPPENTVSRPVAEQKPAPAPSTPPRGTESPYHGPATRKPITVVVRFTDSAKQPVNEAAIRAWYTGKIEAAGINKPYSLVIEEVTGHV